MASLIRMPQKGLSEDSAILSKWYVKEGDTVKTGDYLFAIETGKATFDVESEQDGTVLKCIGEEGDEIAVKEIVCVVGKPGEPFSLGGKAAPAAEAAPAAAAAPAAEAEFETVKNTHLRKLIARNMHDSLSNMAQLTHNSFADVTAMQKLRARIKAEGEKAGLPGISLNDMVIFAVSRTILDFPALNAHYSDNEMKLFKHANIGVAVDTDRGLLVPTIMHADEMSLAEISLKMKELAAECRSGSISPDKLTGASFTVSNLGAFGVTTFTPIINPPQTGILGVCNIETRIRMKNGQPEFYPTMNLSLTYDHRALDGAPASRFLQALANNIANFDLLLAK